jgi:crotonobetainyl-CoA:carnitine CoA-transferase CaiB-like acyl-CoA transferase
MFWHDQCARFRPSRPSNPPNHRGWHPQSAVDLGIAQDVSNAEDRHIHLVGQPVTLSRTPSKMAARPPEFGEQTDEVLAEFGFTVDEISALKQDRVV